MGVEESLVGRIKRTFHKLKSDFPKAAIRYLLWAAMWAHNNTINESGYAPVQWSRSHAPGDALPVGVDASKALEKTIAMCTKATVLRAS